MIWLIFTAAAFLFAVGYASSAYAQRRDEKAQDEIIRRRYSERED